jgi:hypothetical protein
LPDDEELLRSLKDKDLSELMDRLIYGDEIPSSGNTKDGGDASGADDRHHEEGDEECPSV